MICKKSLQLILDIKCNSRCNLCGASWPFNVSWNYEQALHCLEQGVQQGISQVILSGGEVTLRPDLVSIVAQAKAMGYISVTLLTNGRRLDNASYVIDLVSSGASGIGTTLYSSMPGTHDQITGVQGSFKQTMAGIWTICTVAPQIPLSVNIVVTMENFRYLVQTVKFLLNFNIRSLQVTYVVPIGRAKGIFTRPGMPGMTETLPFVRGAVEAFLQAVGDQPHTSITTVFYPRCILRDLARYAGDEDPAMTFFASPEGTLTSLKECLEIDDLTAKASHCKGCVDNKRCIGLWKEYIEVKGYSEINSVWEGINGN